MNRKNTVLLTLLVVIVLLGVLNLMWLADLNKAEINSYNNEIVPLLKSESIAYGESKIIDVVVHENRIYPYTIQAEKGDTLIFSFAIAEEPMFFMLEGYEVNEMTSTDNIEVYLDKEGVFPFYCINCDNKEPGYLIVN